MAVQNVERLPVVEETDRLRGIVSRGDLLRIFLRRDDVIRDDITGHVLPRTLGPASSEVTVGVCEGQVALGGSVDVKGLTPVVERPCRSVDGVVPVSEHVAYRNDDSRTPGTWDRGGCPSSPGTGRVRGPSRCESAARTSVTRAIQPPGERPARWRTRPGP
jgi:hypothetical protein